jgi:hypothetical protein
MPQEIEFLAVRLEGAQLAPRLANTTLQLVVELESAGGPLRQVVKAHSDSTAYVHFGSTLRFPWRAGSAAVLRVRVSKVQLVSRTIASEELRIPSGSYPSQSKHDVVLFGGHSGRFVGELDLSLDLQVLVLEDLSSSEGGDRSDGASNPQSDIRPQYRRWQSMHEEEASATSPLLGA